MAITFIAATNTTYASRTNTTVNAPTGLTNGDYVLVCILTGGGTPPDAVAPSGWTQLTSTSAVSGGFTVKMKVYGKVASSEPTSWTWTHNASSSQGFALAYRGVNTTTPMDVTPTTSNTTASTTTWTGVTTITNGAMIVAMEHDWGDNTIDTVVPTGTTPTFTERLDVVLSYACDGIMTTAGATGNKSHTNNSTGGDPSQGHLFALRPASALNGSSPYYVYNGTTWVNTPVKVM